jgi:ribosomal protein S18 acetylase RimI-like enzyme
MWELRDARPEDAAEVAGVHVRSWQVAYRGLLPDDYLDGLRPEERAARYTFGSSDPHGPATVVACLDHVICGFVTTGRSRDADTSDMGEILALYVDPPSWDLGVGHRLMTDARVRLGQGHFTDAVLWVLVGNERAQRFYHRDGWGRDDGQDKAARFSTYRLRVSPWQ